jgi:NAD(P)-dependent dehydrogenase (short-subunit alcohol dehydrogenase family)
VTSDASIAAAAQRIEKDFGRLDILVNNAGVAAEGERPGASLREQYAETFDVNVFGVMAVIEAFIPLLSKSTAKPNLVVVSSRLGSLSLIANAQDLQGAVTVPAYRSSKAAVNMVTVYYAKRFLKEGWKVNACCPGYTATDLNHFRGSQTVQEAAVNIVRLATLDENGPTGTFSDKERELPW